MSTKNLNVGDRYVRNVNGEQILFVIVAKEIMPGGAVIVQSEMVVE